MANTKRLLVSLSGKADEMLEEITEELGMGSKSKIIRYALSLYFTIYKKAQEGYELCLVKDDEMRIIDSPEFVPMPNLRKNKKRKQKESLVK